MPQPAAGRGRYMAGLDGLRAVAVLSVIAYHLNLGWAPGGLLGVGVFFVLSGYLITDLLLAQRSIDGGIQLAQFWLRRARRLLPALWLMLAVVIVWVAASQPAQLSVLRGDVLGAFLYVSNWSYLLQHLSYFSSFGPPSPFGHLWSLAVEEQFYLAWPLLLIGATRFIRRREVLLICVVAAGAASAIAMALLYQPGGDPSRVYFGTDTRAFELLFGAALALVWPSRTLNDGLRRIRRGALDATGLVGLAVVVLMVVRTSEYDPFLYHGGLVLLSIAAAAAVAALAHPATLSSRALGWAPLRWIGVRSYGIYLWHFPIIVLTTPLVDTPGPHLLRAALQVGACIGVAALSWRWIEEPIRSGGFSAVVTRVRAVRWPVAALPSGLWDGTAAAALVAGFAGVALTGYVPLAGDAQVASLAVSTRVSLPEPIVPAAGSTSCVTVWVTRSPGPITTAPRVVPPPPPPPADTTAVGDSIMLDVAPYLRGLVPGVQVDGAVSRQMYQLPGVLAQLRDAGKLKSHLVIELGTNGPFDPDTLAGWLRALGPMQRIVLVNTQVPRPWMDVVNAELAQAAARVTNASVADWNGASAGHPEYFYADAVHPNPSGSQVLASLIARAVDPAPAPAPQPAPEQPAGAAFRCEPA